MLALPLLLFGSLEGPVAAQAQTDLSALTGSLKSYHYGEKTEALDLIRSEVRRAVGAPQTRDAARCRAIADALAAVAVSDASFDARQFACRQLVFVADDAQVPALAGLLSDATLAHYALLVLARLHTPASADALARALPQSRGRTEIEILDTLADMGDRRATAAAAERLRSGDTATHDAAAVDLAKIADDEAVRALRAGYGNERDARRASVGNALLMAASRLQRSGAKAVAVEILKQIDHDPASSFLGAAAMRELALAEGPAGADRLVQALRDNQNARRQDAAATALREMAGSEAVTRLAAGVGAMTGRGQVLAVEILGDRADAAAAPAIAALCRSADPALRAAALTAAGSLGDAGMVQTLLSAASTGTADERASARASLVRMRGAAVDRALLATLDSGAPPLQVQAIQALSQRATLGVSPRLMKAARSASSAVASAAIKAMRDQGSPMVIPGLTDLLLTGDADRRDVLIDAIAQIVRRAPDVRLTSSDLYTRLATAGKPEDRVALVTVIGQIGGPDSLNSLRRSAADPSAPVRLAALTALAEWPTDEPMADLLRAARAGGSPATRAVALRGYLRMASGSEQRSPAQALALLHDVQALITRPEEKRLALAGLAKISSPEALEAAMRYRQEADVRAEAELAAAEICRATIGAWPERSRPVLETLATSAVNADAKSRAAATLAVSRKFGDFVVAWEVSPGYQQDGADYLHLFDIAFPPETKEAEGVPWRPLPVGGNADQPWLLDLLALSPGEQKVAYLRTAVYSDSARDLVLEMGSDDGLKVWWNGHLELADNTARAVAPGQERAPVHARKGWNVLLLKVTQNNQGWGACVRIANPNGPAAEGLRFALPSSLPAADRPAN